MITLRFVDFDDAAVAVLDEYLAQANFTRTPGRTGEIDGRGMKMRFDYDTEAGFLHLDLITIPEGSSAEHVNYVVKKMLETRRPFDVAGRHAELLQHHWPWG